MIATPTTTHVWELYEITLSAQKPYANPYTEVTCWVTLSGPDFKKRVYGFWDGGNQFKVRLVATAPGDWTWQSGSNTDDPGLSGQSGRFEALPWTEAERAENPNRRGFIRPTANGHALEYADGTPFFLLADTWWSASTWRFPFKGAPPEPNYVPGPGLTFEDALAYRQGQGYNSIALIAAFPNWDADRYPPQYRDENGIGLRQAWEKNGRDTAKDMADEEGNRPFAPLADRPIVADFDQLNPAYFRSLDRKMAYLSDIGFVPFLETVRRDHGPPWKAYFDWPGSFIRYVQYIIARYGAFNLIFSGIHLDWLNEHFSLTPEDYNQALTAHYQQYGPLPFGQPYTTLIEESTYRQFGHAADAPWLTMHSVGNKPRNHGFYPMLEELFRLEPAYPAANLEAYYPGWNHPTHNRVAGEQAAPGSERDNYFGRAQMYGSVLSGGLAGHAYGTGAYCGNTTGEPAEPGARPFLWEGLRYEAGAQMQHLRTFLLSEGKVYQSLQPAAQEIDPCKAADSQPDGLDGWSFMLRTPDKGLAFLYFEVGAQQATVQGLKPETDYALQWFDVIRGTWRDSISVTTDEGGSLALPPFPGRETTAGRDWALKLKIE